MEKVSARLALFKEMFDYASLVSRPLRQKRERGKEQGREKEREKGIDKHSCVFVVVVVAFLAFLNMILCLNNLGVFGKLFSCTNFFSGCFGIKSRIIFYFSSFFLSDNLVAALTHKGEGERERERKKEREKVLDF